MISREGQVYILLLGAWGCGETRPYTEGRAWGWGETRPDTEGRAWGWGETRPDTEGHTRGIMRCRFPLYKRRAGLYFIARGVGDVWRPDPPQRVVRGDGGRPAPTRDGDFGFDPCNPLSKSVVPIRCPNPLL